MSLAMSRLPAREIHPLHAFLLVGATCYLVSGLLCDWLYFSTHEIQWKNFASWLIMGGLVFGGFALLWALIDVFRDADNRGQRILYAGLLLAAWILSFVNELIHAKDAWASMPEAVIISAIVAVLIVAAAWIGLGTLRQARRWA